MTRTVRHPRVLAALFIAASAAMPMAQTPAGGGAPVVREWDITYAQAQDVALKLDLARPAIGGPFPAIIFLFGGGYASGSRSTWASDISLAATRGYVGVAIDYRLTDVRDSSGKPKYTFPAQLHDAKCAVRFLRANAGKLNIDGDRIAVVGFSAGGNLALMLGLTEPSDGLEGSCGEATISSRVQAVVNLAGGVDLVMHHKTYSYYYEPLLGGTPDQVPDRYRKASPIRYLGGLDAPILTLCGTLDPSLPQQRLLDERMKQAGGDHTLVVLEGVTHSQYQLADFSRDNPAWSFLDKHLKTGQ